MKNLFLLIGLLSLTGSYAQYDYSYTENQVPTGPETGIAVYYADYLHGRKTASGELYRMEAFTAAHKSYPFGTMLRVTRLDNGQSVTVRVNDRGPFDPNVLVDLSKAAALKIGLVKSGRARVRVEKVGYSQPKTAFEPTPEAYGAAPAQPRSSQRGGKKYTFDFKPVSPSPPPPAPSSYGYEATPKGAPAATFRNLPAGMSGYAIQLASYQNPGNAARQVNQLEKRGLENLYVWQRSGYYKVVVAPFASKAAATAYLGKLRSQYLQDGLVVKLN